MDAIADLHGGEIDGQRVGDGIDRAGDVDGMADDVEDAAAAQAGRAVLVDEADRYADSHLGAGTDAHEIDVQRRIADRVVLDLASQGAMHRPADRDVDDRREEPGTIDRARQRARFEGDLHRRVTAAIDDAGNAATASRRPRRALAGALARLGGEADDLGHFRLLQSFIEKRAAGRPFSPRREYNLS